MTRPERAPITSPAVVCVLHGDPAVPAWLSGLARSMPLVLVLNDPGPHRYRRLPDACITIANEAPAGFAANVNRAVAVVLDGLGVDVFLVVNFDLEVDLGTLRLLADAVRAEPDLAASAPMLSDADGRRVRSAGRLPRPHDEFLRAAGLRRGGALRLPHALLRFVAGRRTDAPDEELRVLGPDEYLPFTCIAISRRAWEDVGGLDERFRLYAEDIDWSVRAASRGWRLGLFDATGVVHEERWTQSPVTDGWHEASHRRLHHKYGWRANLLGQRLGLGLRRWTPLRWLTPPISWEAVSE